MATSVKFYTWTAHNSPNHVKKPVPNGFFNLENSTREPPKNLNNAKNCQFQVG